MEYVITKIEISEEATGKLIKDIKTEIDKVDASVLDKGRKEFYLHTEDDLIDIWFGVEFISEYKYGGCGGVITNWRSVRFDIKFTYEPSGDEIEVNMPISIEDEIKEHYTIDE